MAREPIDMKPSNTEMILAWLYIAHLSWPGNKVQTIGAAGFVAIRLAYLAVSWLSRG